MYLIPNVPLGYLCTPSADTISLGFITTTSHLIQPPSAAGPFQFFELPLEDLVAPPPNAALLLAVLEELLLFLVPAE